MLIRPRPRSVLLVSILSLVLLSSYYRIDRFLLPTHVSFEPPTVQAHDTDLLVNTTKILVVSAFFPLSKSKHPHEYYVSWLSKFLRPVKTPIYFFTSPEMEGMIRELRGDLPITINSTFHTPFDVPPLKGLEGEYERIHNKDRENFRHSPELYAVWNAKPYFLDTAVTNLQVAGHTYDYAFWNDAGSFRGDQVYGEWPDSQRVDDVWQAGSELTGTAKEDLIFYPMARMPESSSKHWVESDGPIDVDFSEGSFFGGSPKAIRWWMQTFYTYHDYYLFQKDYFVGKDQTVFNALFLLFPERIITVWQYDPQAPNYVGLPGWALGPCGSNWFYYQFFFAAEADRETMRDIWKSGVEWPWSWFTDGRCRMARLLAIKDVLKRQFGKNWISPEKTVDIGASYRP